METYREAVDLVAVGGLAFLAMLVKTQLTRLGLPAVVGYLALGFAFRAVSHSAGWLTEQTQSVLDFLGSVGVVFLLFRVGLDADLTGLRRQLRSALVLAALGVLVSGGLGYAAARLALGLDLLPSIFVATALSATSVGVALASWQEADRLRSPAGELLTDTAELDDVICVVAVAALVSVAPLLVEGGDVLPTLAQTLVVACVKILAFGVACTAFGLFLERRLMKRLQRLERPPEAIVSVGGVGLLVAGLAAAFGFSPAIGAFFAGLAFSRDPDAVRLEIPFDPLYDFFVPFFFIGIGAHVPVEIVVDGLGLAVALVLVAVVGKLVGNGLLAGRLLGPAAGLAFGLSMIPRAEIAMVVMNEGRKLGEWAVSPELYAAMAVVTLLTCGLTPFAIRRSLRSG